MAVTGLHSVGRHLYDAQVEKIVGSVRFHSSESLCKLLRYLSDHSLEHPGTPLKEYQIATEVFGRPTDFDPQTDSTIRVQASRLRIKLADYYAKEGAADRILVELPKGAYLLSFRLKTHATAGGADPASTTPFVVPPTSHAAASETVHPSSVITLLSLIAVALLLSTISLAWLLATRAPAKVSSTRPDAPIALRTFWGAFVDGAEPPWVIFSNAAFVGRPETGMHYLKGQRESNQLVLDHYTGVGEVLAVHELDRVFAQLHREIRVKRGSLFTLDDANKNNLIFVGSPVENLSLSDLPGTRHFVFKHLPSGPHPGDLAIANLRPAEGEPEAFYPSPSNLPVTEDYAIVSIVNGLDPTHLTMILAGTTTIGTEAAVEYVSRQDSVQDLLRRLGNVAGQKLQPFEAVLKVKVSHGVPVKTELLAVRKD